VSRHHLGITWRAHGQPGEQILVYVCMTRRDVFQHVSATAGDRDRFRRAPIVSGMVRLIGTDVRTFKVCFAGEKPLAETVST
jgi:hypothetical protein